MTLPSWEHSLLLIAGGAVAGFLNTLAGGGSFISVPLLTLIGLPATVANATNRLAVLTQNVAAVAGFRSEGVSGVDLAVRLLPATLLGAWLGALFASEISDELFARGFGILMIVALPVVLWKPQPRDGRRAASW